MSLWICPNCETLQPWTASLTCDCGGRLEIAEVVPVTEQDDRIGTAPRLPD